MTRSLLVAVPFDDVIDSGSWKKWNNRNKNMDYGFMLLKVIVTHLDDIAEIIYSVTFIPSGKNENGGHK